jgi:hypothetical protein
MPFYNDIRITVPDVFRGSMAGLCGKFGDEDPSPGVCELLSTANTVMYTDFDQVVNDLTGRPGGDYILSETPGFLVIVRLSPVSPSGTTMIAFAIQTDNNTAIFIPGNTRVNGVVLDDPVTDAEWASLLKNGTTGHLDPDTGTETLTSPVGLEVDIGTVPEPATAALVITGFGFCAAGAFGFRLHRKRRMRTNGPPCVSDFAD